MQQTLTHKSYYEILKSQAGRLLPEAEYTGIVTAAQQAKEIKLLKNTLHYEKFFFVINHHSFITEEVHGIKRWLGYAEKEFTIKKYFSIIHPAHLIAQMTSAYELLESFISGEWPIGFMSHSFINTIALQHANGEYLLFKRIAWPFQHDAENRLLSILNEFTLVGRYNNEPYTVRLADTDGNAIDWNDEMLKRTKHSFQKQMAFSLQEQRLLGKYAYNPGLTTAEIAAMFNIKDSTVITYKKRILSKAEKLFHQRFKTAKHVAEYLREQGLV